jgi:gliding motility-associated lipoprotein GldJ
MKNKSLLYLFLLLAMGTFAGCGGNNNINFVGKSSTKTGMKYNEDDGFQVKNFRGMEPAPGMIFIQGGTMIMGGGEKDIEFAENNRERQVTVHSFYLDETEVANVDWKEFLFYINRDSGEAMFTKLYPDTTVWLRDLAFNDPYSQYYYSHIAFNTYPVVGINWHQSNEYCKWRTAIVNQNIREADPEAVLYPAYRLPTEAEWEYAARGLLEQENYPWEGKSLRDAQGKFRANFKRGRGDYAGWAGGDGRHYTDGYMITSPVRSFYPNDFGLYNMAGNVCEWTMDTYRSLNYEDVEDLNPNRRKGKTDIRPDVWLDDVVYGEPDGNGAASLLWNPDPNAPTSNVFDNIKVYRGGSWADVAYFLTPGSRRFYNADSSSAMIGMRCAMIRLGSPF